jgi:hypothetical protein
MPKFVVYNYPAEGEDVCARDEAWFSNAWEAFNEAAHRVGGLDEWRRWIGFEPPESGLVPVAAFSASRETGCGGVQISCMPDVVPSTNGQDDTKLH